MNNDRIKNLALEADATVTFYGMNLKEGIAFCNYETLGRFVDLIRQDYLEEMNGHTLKMVMIAIAREREACAMLCEEWYLSGDVAKAIRSRN